MCMSLRRCQKVGPEQGGSSLCMLSARRAVSMWTAIVWGVKIPSGGLCFLSPLFEDQAAQPQLEGTCDEVSE